MVWSPTPPIYVPQGPSTDRPQPQVKPPRPSFPYPPSGGQGPSWELPPPPEQGPETQVPSDGGGFDREAWFQRWRNQRASLRPPVNAGANQLPQPSIRDGRGQAPSVERVGNGAMPPFPQKPFQPPWMNFGPPSFGAQLSAPRGVFELPPQQPETAFGREQYTAEEEDEMPAWMRARLRRNPGGGGELGRGRGPRSGGKPPMQSMPMGAPQMPPQLPAQQAPQFQQPNGAVATGRPPRFMADQDPRFGGFDFMF